MPTMPAREVNNKLLNKKSELMNKCCYDNKFILSNYKSNDNFIYQGNTILFEDSYVITLFTEDCM